MSDVKKVELGYSVPKERWKDAAENLREFGDLYAAKLIKENMVPVFKRKEDGGHDG